MLRKLFINIFLLLLPFLLVLGYLVVENPIKKQLMDTDYLAAIADKEAEVKKLTSPKILIVGGSNAAYSISAEEIQKQLKIPTYNLAFQYSFGLYFMLNQADKLTKQGDVILLSPEYFLDLEGDPTTMWRAVDFYGPAFEYVRFNNPLKYVSSYLIFKLSQFKLLLSVKENSDKDLVVSDTSSVFFRKAFNQNGDLISHLNNPSKPVSVEKIDYAITHTEKVKFLKEFNQKLKNKGVRLIITFPPLHKPTLEHNQLELYLIYKKYKNSFVCLGSPENFAYQDPFIFDHVNHLNKLGRIEHTNKIIRHLKILLINAF